MPKAFEVELKVGKWGNSLGIRLPKELQGRLTIKEGETILAHWTKDGPVILEKKEDD